MTPYFQYITPSLGHIYSSITRCKVHDVFGETQSKRLKELKNISACTNCNKCKKWCASYYDCFTPSGWEPSRTNYELCLPKPCTNSIRVELTTKRNKLLEIQIP